MNRFHLFGVVAALAVTSGLRAASLAINNPGFESQFVSDGFVQLAFPTGWIAYNPANLNGTSDTVALLNPTGTAHFPGGAFEGRNVSVVFMDGPATGEAGLQQTLTAVLESGLQYTLSVAVGNIASGTANFGFFNLNGFPGYRVDLLAGSTVIASDNNSLGGTIPEGQFAVSVLNFTAGNSHPQLGEPLGIRLVNLNISGTEAAPGIEVNFDDVQLTAAAVPEPATSGLIVAGGIVVVALWRGRRAGG